MLGVGQQVLFSSMQTGGGTLEIGDRKIHKADAGHRLKLLPDARVTPNIFQPWAAGLLRLVIDDPGIGDNRVAKLMIAADDTLLAIQAADDVA